VLPRRALALLLLAVTLVTGCAGSGGSSATKATDPPKPPLTYVAVGASETVGRGADKPETQAWPRVLADKLGAGGRKVTFTGLGFDGATVPEALFSSVPKAEKLAPNLVTVWLNANDIIADFAIPNRTNSYEQQLGEMVHRLRRGGAATVLVANTPALDQLPAYTDCLSPGGSRCLLPDAMRSRVPPPAAVIAKVDSYNQVIAAIAQREGAVLVDLHAASLKARADGTVASLISGDGFHPSTAGHAAVAQVFADAAKKAGV
jgi:lysophospholipase L1-like esterase